MPAITQHAPGTFCWPELATTDAPAAKKFYSTLFGWEGFDVPLGESGAYSLMRKGGQDAGAIYGLMPELRAQGVPPHWMPYIAVASADQTAAKAKALGGEVVKEPFDVYDLGRMVVLRDPVGAVFSAWEAKKHIGVQVLGEPGSLGWTQLNTADPERAAEFYTALLGWTADVSPMGEGAEYTTFLNGTTPAGGAMPMPAGAGPSHWLTYFATADVDGSTARAQQEGGKSMVAPTDIPGVGRFSVVQDPQGAYFALVKFGR